MIQGGSRLEKQSNFSELMTYAGKRKYLTYASLVLSGISSVLSVFPFVFLYRRIQEVLSVAPDFANATHVVFNGWLLALPCLAWPSISAP